MSDQTQIRKLSPADGDIFLLPEDATFEQACELGEAISVACPGIRAMVFRGDLRQLSVAEMNAAGWYRA